MRWCPGGGCRHFRTTVAISRVAPAHCPIASGAVPLSKVAAGPACRDATGNAGRSLQNTRPSYTTLRVEQKRKIALLYCATPLAKSQVSAGAMVKNG